jgi:hypothetical protein
VDALDLLTPYDDLKDLRSVLSAQQIAELTGLRRETISRARPDSRFRRQTVRAFTDLNAVVGRLRRVMGDDPGQLAALLERPQPALGGSSIAELIREGRVDVVLDRLAVAEPTAEEQLENLRLDADVEAELRALEAEDPGTPTDAIADDRVTELIAGDPELGRRLPMIEALIRDRFGADARAERALVADPSDPEGTGHLYLGIRAALPLDEQIDRLGSFLSEEEVLMGPVQTRVTVGLL